MPVVAQSWLISKFVDPVFAIAVGFSAAALRVRREEIAKFPNQDNSFTGLWKKGAVMRQHYFGSNR